MSEIALMKLSSIDKNPLRRLADYPFNSDKIATLRQSIRDVGLWEGVIGRKAGKRIEIAFGHHRVEAARQELGEDAKVAVIVRDLDDEQMLQFMGRENLEDYNADFLVMLESWEAAASFQGRGRDLSGQQIEIARILGWISADGKSNDVANACASALQLVEAKHLKREQLAGLSVSAAREICQHVANQHRKLEKAGEDTKRPAREIEQAKRQVSKAAGDVVKNVKAGKVAQKGIRGEIDVGAYRYAQEAKRRSPLLGKFANDVAAHIGTLLRNDAAATKLAEIKKVLPDIEMPEDVQGVSRIAFELALLRDRASREHLAFSNPTKKVVNLKEAKG